MKTEYKPKKAEKDIYPPIEAELRKQGYNTLQEFGIDVSGCSKRVDVFGCKWNNSGQKIITIAVEAKYIPNGQPRDEFLSGLGQSVDYLPFFDFICLCCRKTDLGHHLTNISRVLTINKMDNIDNKQVILPKTLLPSKFKTQEESLPVLLRSSMLLSFMEFYKTRGYSALKNCFRYSGSWIAADIENGLQRTLFYNEKNKVYMSVNIEHRAVLKKIIENIQSNYMDEFKQLFKKQDKMKLNLYFRHTAPNIETKLINEIPLKDIDSGKLIHDLKRKLDEKGWRANFNIHIPLWDKVKDRQWHLDKLIEGEKSLEELTAFFKKAML